MLPLILGLVYLVAYRIRDRYYPIGHAWRPYFLPGLTVKVAGALFIGLVYQYYYGGGDTANYFFQSRVVNSAFSESPLKWLKLVLHIPDWYDGNYREYTSQIAWYTTLNNYAVVGATALLSIFTFNTFLPTSVLFAFISFSGVWAMFRTFARMYPHLVRPVALATLYIPSTFIWGSGIFKDTVCMFGLGWMIFAAHRVLVQRKFNVSSIALFLFSSYLIFIIKPYILVAFLPALGLWVIALYGDKVKLSFFKPLLFGISGLVFIACLYLFSHTFAAELGQYSLENIGQTSQVTRDYILSVSGDEGSGYSLGTIDPTPLGLLKKAPAGINVGLFRPYIWESRKIFVLFNALEATLFLLLTLKVLLAVGPVRMWRAFIGNGTLQFCLVFAVIFAFAVGISSYNFGALSRYRIPCLPLYGMALVLFYYSKFPADRKLLSFRLKG